MRILDKQQISYEVLTYDSKDGKIDGVSVAQKIERDPQLVYKTLVVQGASKTPYVCVIPVERELDLKKAAKACAEKKVELLPVKQIQAYTGYVRGGCSPLGMKKSYTTFIDESAALLSSIVVSAGKVGLQMELGVAELKALAAAKLVDLKK
ncbi:Cys-tRNA(Pro) deacylase [Ammoniphilus oxalaticus]